MGQRHDLYRRVNGRWPTVSGRPLQTARAETSCGRYALLFKLLSSRGHRSNNGYQGRFKGAVVGGCTNATDAWRLEHGQASEVIAESSKVLKTSKIWNDDGAACLATLEGHQDIVYSAAFAEEGHFATESDDGTAKILNAGGSAC